MTDIPVRIFCFGIGTDINTHLLDKITEKTHAASQYVLPSEDIEVKVSNFYTKINDPVLANLKLTFSGVRITKMEPAEMPDLFRGEQLVVFGRYSGSGDSAIRLEGTVNGKSRTLVYEATFHDKATEYSFIPRLWATRRVGFLLDQIRLHGESKELKDEVTDLARRYGIVTPYTAFLIVEDETHRNVPVLSRTLQTLGGDEPVRREAERMYREVNNAKDGHAAVGGAQSYDSLKSAKSASAPAAANAYAQRGQVGERSATAETVQTAIHNQQTRSIASRTFYQNGSLWIDSNVQQRQDAKRVQVKFNSEEYFALMAKYANAAQWLSVGRNVQILLGETVYEVVE
jgi:Ca-activated chloride channel family protein